MGLLVEGQWHDEWYDTESSGGRFVRQDSQYRHWITRDGSAGPTGEGGFQAEPGRYHLYVSYACPWAHRTLIMRHLKGLEDIISISVVSPIMLEHGWTFEAWNDVVPDTVHHARYLYEIYLAANDDYSGRVTVPVLWDKHREMIVNNESSDILRMFNTAFDEVGALQGDYYPDNLQAEIDDINNFVYKDINNGVYKAGFATEQAVYEEEVATLFAALDQLESRLEGQDFLVGNQLTEADIRLWTTLIRFDPVYYGHFKCNLRRLVDYPNLWRYTRQIYHHASISKTVNFPHIKHHYYESHPTINPNSIVPAGPIIDYSL